LTHCGGTAVHAVVDPEGVEFHGDRRIAHGASAGDSGGVISKSICCTNVNGAGGLGYS